MLCSVLHDTIPWCPDQGPQGSRRPAGRWSSGWRELGLLWTILSLSSGHVARLLYRRGLHLICLYRGEGEQRRRAEHRGG
jgi:hypothetical protein